MDQNRKRQNDEEPDQNRKRQNDDKPDQPTDKTDILNKWLQDLPISDSFWQLIDERIDERIKNVVNSSIQVIPKIKTTESDVFKYPSLPDDISSTNSRSTAYSSFDKKTAEQELNIKFDDLDANILEPSDFLKELEEMANSKIGPLEMDTVNFVYENLFQKIRLYGYPDLTKDFNEYYFQDLIGVYLEKVMIRFKDQVEKVKFEDDLKMVREGDLSGLKLKKSKKPTHGRVEFIVRIEKKRLNEEKWFKLEKFKLLVVEVKKNDIDSGLAQCLIQMRDCFDTNPNKITVYGIATTLNQWVFIKYDGKYFKRSMIVDGVIYEEMIKNKTWLQFNGVLVCKLLHALYSISFNVQ